jgi:hypothetical protein
MTVAPSLENSRAMARPIPLDEPVTIAILFCKRGMVGREVCRSSMSGRDIEMVGGGLVLRLIYALRLGEIRN